MSQNTKNNNKIGLYIYAPTTTLDKIKTYIESSFTSFRVNGTSDAEVASTDVIQSATTRNLRGVLIVLTVPYDAKHAGGVDSIVDSLSTLQRIRNTKLKIFVFVRDSHYTQHFTKLGEYKPEITTIPKTGLQNLMIDECVIAPLMKDADIYERNQNVQSAPKLKASQTEAPISLDLMHEQDMSEVNYEDNLLFTQTLQDVHSQLEDIESSLQSDTWATEAMNNTLGNFEEVIASSSALESYLRMQNPKLDDLSNKTKQLATQIGRYQEAYTTASPEQRQGISESIRTLTLEKENLTNVQDAVLVHDKIKLLSCAGATLKVQGEETISEFNEKLNELQKINSIKDSEDKIESLVGKRRELLDKLNKFTQSQNESYRLLNAEMTTECSVLACKLGEGVDELAKTAQVVTTSKDSKLKEQFVVDKYRLEVLSKEITSLKDTQSRMIREKDLMLASLKEIGNQLRNIVGLDTQIINEYQSLTTQLKNTKTIEMRVSDVLASKLQLVTGFDRCGKTAIATYIGMTLVKRQKSICLVDLDMVTPELHYYTETLVTETLDNFVNNSGSYEDLDKLARWNRNIIVTNQLRDNIVSFNFNNLDTSKDIIENVIEKLEILSNAFDKIIVIYPLSVDEIFEVLYKRAGSVTVISDVNPSTLEDTGQILTDVKARFPEKKLITIVLNKYSNESKQDTEARLNFGEKYKPAEIPFLPKIALSKLTGEIADISNSNLFINLI